MSCIWEWRGWSALQYPISNELIEPEGGIVDVKALDYIMEIGLLVKILQAGLIGENAFAKAKENVSKRYGNHHSFWNKRHAKVNMFLKKRRQNYEQTNEL